MPRFEVELAASHGIELEVNKCERVDRPVTGPILALFAHMQLRLRTPGFLHRSLLGISCIALNSWPPPKPIPHLRSSSPKFRRRKVEENGLIRSLGGAETLDQSSRLLSMRTVGSRGCNPGRLTSDRDGDR
jgi:hypothetical protein